MPTTTIRQLAASDAEAFAALRREVTADNPVPMGLTLEEELTRPLDGFREQLSFPEPNAAFGAFVGSALVPGRASLHRLATRSLYGVRSFHHAIGDVASLGLSW